VYPRSVRRCRAQRRRRRRILHCDPSSVLVSCILLQSVTILCKYGRGRAHGVPCLVLHLASGFWHSASPSRTQLQHNAASRSRSQKPTATQVPTATQCRIAFQKPEANCNTSSNCNTMPHRVPCAARVPCSVLQCVAVRCSVLQCVAVCCSVLQCVAVCCCVFECVAMKCDYRHHTLVNAMHGSAMDAPNMCHACA